MTVHIVLYLHNAFRHCAI